MSDKDAQPEQQDTNPWAPPEHSVSLEKPGSRSAREPSAPAAAPAPAPLPQPTQAAMPAAAPAPAGPTTPGRVPPVPLAPTGPGTPSAYPGGAPYGQAPYAPPGYPQSPVQTYGQQPPYGQPPYGQPPYGQGDYGYPPAAVYGQGWQTPRMTPNNGLGVAALVLGIIGTVLCWTLVISFICGVLAIVFGAIGRGKVRTGEATNSGQALAGLILGGAALVATALMVVVYINVDERDDTRYAPDDPDATYGAYLPAPPGPASLVFPAASR
ncbi:DUF4190 domain-containing protein [Streptomyces netropsis]|uniref:DUF4190 domain-containing protein n=1 Tax=Streptomyces netropsis TaxID=55404 RepID=A0A7W7LHD8_STRNE|nr:DUF4190 domain-containing protein [Streptomyces netropsis]MBB4890275.1 hypothetical protein [Streptomyces netropsis]GGR44799.1 hypothetical protein GCM10010219_57820 [Streptomyces netropsis]